MKGSIAGEEPWVLPEGWRWERIEDVAPVNPKRKFGDPSDEDLIAFVPMAAVAEVSGKINLGQLRPAAEVRKGYTRFQSGDVIFAKITPCMENGKIAVIPELPSSFGAGSTEFHVLAPERIEARFLFYWLSQHQFRQEAEFNMTGTAGQKRVPPDYLRNASIPVPDLETQRRIVVRIDELFSELDDGEEELARARADLETYRKALLKAAVTGELTADWRAGHQNRQTGQDLLRQIIDERRALPQSRKSGCIGKISGPEGELTFALPDSWAYAAVGQLGEIVTGSTPSTSRPEYYGGEVLFYTPGDLESPIVNNTKRTLTAAGLASVRSISKGSILVTCIGATIGKLAIAGAAGATNQQINAVIPSSPTVGRWVYTYLASPLGQQEIVGRSSSTTMPILNKGDFSRLPIPLPPENEIGEIMRVLDSVSPDAEAAADDIAALGEDQKTLRQSILAAAFRGELVS